MSSRPRHRSTTIGLLGLVLLAAIAIVVWFSRSDEAASPPLPAVSAMNPKPAAAPARETPPDAVPAPSRSSVATAPALLAGSEPPPAAIPPAPEQADLEARDWLSLRVVDERQAPIFDAEVMIRGLRKQGDAGSWYSMRGGETRARTDRDGRARVDYTRWVDIDGKAVRVDLLVTHPDFIPFSESSFVLAPGEPTIELKQGAMVWLTAWHGAQDRVISDVRIQVEWQARVGQEGWTRERDGRWSTTRLAPGPHWITVAHESAELGTLASEFTPFELGEHARLDLALELKPLVSLRGRLDDSIPRPVVGGHVMVNLHASDGEFGLSSEHEATVSADGTFTIDGLRAASGQAIALCDGWVSKLVPPPTLAESRVRLSANPTETQKHKALARARARERAAQRVDVTAGEELVVEMEPAGTLEVRVTDEQGTPLAGVTISAWPNVSWIGVGSSIFPWRDWNAESDPNGLGSIANLPVDSTFIGVQSSTHQLRKAERDEHPRALIESGKVTRIELVLEKIL